MHNMEEKKNNNNNNRGRHAASSVPVPAWPTRGEGGRHPPRAAIGRQASQAHHVFFSGLSSRKYDNPNPKIQIWPQLASITTGEDHIQEKRHAALKRRTLGPRGTC